MALRINGNTDAASAHRALGTAAGQLSRSLSQLASGKRIVSARDDAAGLAIAETLSAQVRGSQQGVRNAQDGISVLQTAEGALGQVAEQLQRVRELTVQAGNGTLSAEQRGAIQAEIAAVQQSIDQTAGTAQFNGQKLLDGSAPSVSLQTGANADQTTQVALPNATTSALGVDGANVDVSSPAAANASLATIDAAISAVSSARGRVGAQVSGIEHTIASENVAAENQISARSRIADLDYAKAVVEETRNQLLVDVSTAMLAQANLNRGSVLRLLQQ